MAPTVVAPGAGYVVAAPYGLNGNGYGNGYGYRNGPPPPAYYNGDPVLSAYGRARLSILCGGRRRRFPTTATDAVSPAAAMGAAIEKQPLLTYCRATPRDARVPGSLASFELAAAFDQSHPPTTTFHTTLEVEDGRVVAVYIVRNPDKLRHMADTLH